MQYRLWKGRKISVIGLGTAHFGGQVAAGLAADMLDAYLALGGNLIDTARVYGDFAGHRLGESEKVIGRWLERQRREDIFLSTKGGHPDMEHMEISRLNPAEILDDAARSLDNLRVESVDIYFLHRDDPARPVSQIAETLQEIVEKGMAKHVGVSNWTVGRIREMNEYAAAHGLAGAEINQIQMSLARQERLIDPTLIYMDQEGEKWHRETGMPLFAFSSQAGGYFSKLRSLGPEGLPEALRIQYDSPDNRAIADRLEAVCRETGYSPATASLAYLTAQPFPVYPLVGASRLSQVEAIADAGDAALTPAQRDFLRVI